MREQAGELLQPDAGGSHGQVHALLLQVAHVGGDAAHSGQGDAVDERARQLGGEDAVKRTRLGTAPMDR